MLKCRPQCELKPVRCHFTEQNVECISTAVGHCFEITHPDCVGARRAQGGGDSIVNHQQLCELQTGPVNSKIGSRAKLLVNDSTECHYRVFRA